MKETARLHTPEPHGVQLQLEMDAQSLLLLKNVMGKLEASSYGEVIRRALQAYETVEPMDQDSGVLDHSRYSPSVNQTDDVRRLHVRIQPRTKERLTRAKERTGLTQSEVLNQAVLVLAQLVRNREINLKGGHDEQFEITKSAMGKNTVMFPSRRRDVEEAVLA